MVFWRGAGAGAGGGRGFVGKGEELGSRFWGGRRGRGVGRRGRGFIGKGEELGSPMYMMGEWGSNGFRQHIIIWIDINRTDTFGLVGENFGFRVILVHRV
ncbi:hypothetical protein QYF36_009247 [Acer negundo]|nr:hypothetical protein QYF36_009247 [Acer negundo]